MHKTDADGAVVLLALVLGLATAPPVLGVVWRIAPRSAPPSAYGSAAPAITKPPDPLHDDPAANRSTRINNA